MTRTEKAVASFQSGYNCSQSTFMVFIDDLGLEKPQSMKLASGFGAGMGRMQEVCGAVSGGVLALGARFGHGEPTESEAQKKTYALVQEFFRRFQVSTRLLPLPGIAPGNRPEDRGGAEAVQGSGYAYKRKYHNKKKCW
jgi:C_GCAxxG_C_C family probable redox protein